MALQSMRSGGQHVALFKQRGKDGCLGCLSGPHMPPRLTHFLCPVMVKGTGSYSGHSNTCQVTHEHLVTELMTLTPWTANDKSEQEAREEAQSATTPLNIFMSCSSNRSSKRQS